MANENGWGDGSVNNAIGWGQGANNAISWGKSHLDSWSGATDIIGTPAIDPDAQAFITAASITDPTQQSAINQLVVDLKGYNIWTKMQAIYPMIGGTNSQHTWNLRNTSQFQISWQGGVTSSANGVQFNGTNSYGITGYNPSVNGSLNSHHLSFYSRTQSNGTEVEFGSIDAASGNGSLMEIRTAGTTYFRINNGVGTISFLDADSRAFYIANRTASNVFNGWRNSTKAVNGTLASSALGLREYYLGAFNNNTVPSFYTTKQCAFASIGDGLSDTEAANFYTAVQAFQTTLGRQVGTPIPYASFPLDTYSGASAAYSLRRLRTAYTGSLIRVRRSSDNTEMDFGYNSNNVLDTSALLTFCGAGNGFVTTWYDQSGNSRNSTQTTAINQPQIVSSGSVIINNGTNAISFDGSNDSLNPIDFALPTSSIFSVVRTLAPNQYNSIYSRGTTSSSNYSRDALLYINRTANRLEFQRSNNVNFPTSVILINLNNTILATGIYTGSALNVYANGTIGTSQSTTISGTTSNASSSIGALKENAITSFYLTGFINEIIVYDSDQSTNRTGIESNINTFYTIY